jgi:D-alanyl-D-alanine carboxypeptidase
LPNLRLIFIALTAGLVLQGAPAGGLPKSPHILVDLEKGLVIDDQYAGQKWYPASLTKLMTTYVVFRAMSAGEVTLETPVTISANALAEPPSKMGYAVGTKMSVDNALKMLLVKSANDIAVALAEAVGGTEPQFIARMNAEAARLGMSATHYTNPNGLPSDDQITSARDQAVLARALWSEFPEYRSYFGITAIQSGKRILRTYNPLLERYNGATGMKTGFICNSGFNLVATATRDGRSMLVVVMGAYSAKGRAESAALLLDQGFRSWRLAKQNLDVFTGSMESAAPINMRQDVCARRKGHEGEDLAEGEGAPISALGPRVHVMDPVRVVTMAKQPAATRVKGMPIPRPRPAEEEVHAQAYSPDASPPSIGAIGEGIRATPTADHSLP